MVKKRAELAIKGKAQMYKIIYSDYSMPKMDGPAVARAVRKLYKEDTRLAAARVPPPYICCVTAYNEPTFKKEAIAAGMDYFLVKPVGDD